MTSQYQQTPTQGAESPPVHHEMRYQTLPLSPQPLLNSYHRCKEGQPRANQTRHITRSPNNQMKCRVKMGWKRSVVQIIDLPLDTNSPRFTSMGSLYSAATVRPCRTLALVELTLPFRQHPTPKLRGESPLLSSSSNHLDITNTNW